MPQGLGHAARGRKRRVEEGEVLNGVAAAVLSAAAEHVAAFTLWPQGPDCTRIACEFLFHESEVGKPGFDPADVANFWDLVNRQDWGICESVQRGMRSRGFRGGFYAPMEDPSLDIRRYLARRLGELPGIPRD